MTLSKCALIGLVSALTISSVTLVQSSALSGTLVGNADAIGSVKIKNLTGENVYDFHITIKNHDPTMKIDKASQSGRGGIISTPNNNDPQNPGFDVNFFPFFVIQENDEYTFSIKITAEKNEWLSTNAYWTDRSHEKVKDVTIPGFSVVDDPIYTIFNESSVPIGIRNLQFLVNVPEIYFGSLDPGSEPGFGAVMQEFILSANSSKVFNVPGIINPGNYLYAQGEMYNVESGEVIGAFIHGHQSIPVPESSVTLGLLTFGAFSTTVSMLKRKQSKQKSTRGVTSNI